jgi:putative CocE/NonD family hydrolase
LSEKLELAGNPRVVLNLASSALDAAVFVYLEDVASDGTVRYLTEGQLRLMHRRGDDTAPSFLRRDANPVMPGSLLRIVVPLMPVAAILKTGHRLRIAIAGHDADTFARYPESGEVSFEIHRGGADATRLELPVVVGSRSNRVSS